MKEKLSRSLKAAGERKKGNERLLCAAFDSPLLLDATVAIASPAMTYRSVRLNRLSAN